ncbi:MAG: NAD(+) synthase [Proteobacteria bacterium]|nr:NAD(+) synthase [Pseudomonadota bacterium]
MNVKAVINTICSEIKSHVDTAVVGLSGGADSFLVMLLSAEALGRENVYAFSLPYSDTDVKTFNSLSKMYADHIGVHHTSVSIKAVADALTATISGIFDPRSSSALSTLNAGNARSRARMCVLYGAAHHLNETLNKRVRVMGTGNLSEDFIGYDTKGGDALADIFPIGQLFKSEVYKLLEYFRDQGKITEAMINRVPSAGLWENQTDEDELGYTYNAMEPAIRHIIKHYSHIDESGLDPIQHFVWNRHTANKHKHEAPFVIKLRDEKGQMIP